MTDAKQIDRLKKAFRVASAAWDRSAERTVPGEVACRAGCFGCCVGLFDISIPEAMLVREGVARLSGPDRDDVLRRARRIVEGTADAFPGDAASGLLDPERSEEADDDYFAVVADRACPMLELPSGRCRIYEERPITCRTYGFAWATDGAVFHPPCGLNLPGASAERQLETSIDLGSLDQAEDVAEALALELGLEPDRETTIPHAVLGTAFGSRPG
ncbi:MAG: YkgJ family cysteine cluster protein [Holophagales bacterium]|jgi:Fe-S-cluster containining protein|nr:YkgJ family cysteine cluster protein [Holophagales bacterium]MBK9968509.1 YkgJ family cysteine cluster protein [Holophagales bacterium]